MAMAKQTLHRLHDCRDEDEVELQHLHGPRHEAQTSEVARRFGEALLKGRNYDLLQASWK
jgi:hypothetical protein